MTRLTVPLSILVLLLTLAPAAMAGGWATVRLDEPPGDVLAGETWRFGFRVLQHDITPNSDVTPLIRAVHRQSGLEVSATGRQEGEVGHFVADLTLPEPGEWKWAIEPAPFADTTFPTLHVVTGAAGEVERDALQRTQAADEPATETIEMIDGIQFQPARLEAEPGDTVTWTNRSTLAHAVSLDDLDYDDSGLLEPGQSFSLTFAEPGTYHYRCSPHPGMEGVIIIT